MDAARYYEDRKGQYEKSLGVPDEMRKSAGGGFAASVTGADILDAYLAKAGGEGSRGGKIIGHTKSSNKPIYAADHSANQAITSLSPKAKIRDIINATIRAHGNYSAKDHRDAGDAHEKASKRDGDVHSKLAEAHHLAGGFVGARDSKARKSFEHGDGDGDHSHQFAAAQSADPDATLVRPVSDVSQSPLNDAIAATWPGMPFMAQASNNFCALMNGGKI